MIQLLLEGNRSSSSHIISTEVQNGQKVQWMHRQKKQDKRQLFSQMGRQCHIL